MSIFSRIKSAIFGQAQAAAPVPKATEPTAPQSVQAPVNAAPSNAPEQDASNITPMSASAATVDRPKPAAAAAPVAPASPQTSASGETVNQHMDIEKIMNTAVAKSGQKLDWRHSIVDFMKALGMDASIEERKELAAELGYTGDTHDSAKMNLFLHKALMNALAENGGKVPAALMD